MNIKLLTIESMPANCSKVLGLVSASCCVSKSLVGDMTSNIKNWTIGGELPQYTELIDSAVEIVHERLAQKAEKMGADAVIGIRMSTTQVSEGAAEIIMYGTAVSR